LLFRFPFIGQHTHGNVINKIAGRNADHQHGFVLPHVYDLAFDNFTGLNLESNGRAYFEFRFSQSSFSQVINSNPSAVGYFDFSGAA
jgi:hypothetical protein